MLAIGFLNTPINNVYLNFVIVMKEDFLHYLWKHKLFFQPHLTTTDGELLTISSVGNYNLNAGPDFHNAKLRIGEQLWAGTVEIHLKSSDWYVHNHEQDSNYDSVILHVVWEHDVDVYNSGNSRIPTLELKHVVSKDVLLKYQELFTKKRRWIQCETQISHVDSFSIDNWLERIYFERLERKSGVILELLKSTNYDWEAVLFQLLARNFGLKVNADIFFEMSQKLSFSVVRKEASELENLESLFFGTLGMLQKDLDDSYYQKLKSNYEYQSKKHRLTALENGNVQYFRLRPVNFPTIRISQLAGLYTSHQNLFSKCMETSEVKGFYELFSITASAFWDMHYTFEKESKKRVKKLSKSFIDLLLINTIVPLKFVYLKHIGKLDEEAFLMLMKALKSEKNSIIDKFEFLKLESENAMRSQALLELKNEYCAPQKCLQCAIGNYLLSSK